MLVGLLILVTFAIGAALMISRRLPALLVLPLMGAAIAIGTWLLTGAFDSSISMRADILDGVVGRGSFRLADAMVAAFFGGMLSFIMQKSGVAHSMIKQGAELIGDNPLAVAFFSMILVAFVFTTIGGLGAIIMVAIVVLPMLATVGVPPITAGGILLIGISMGGAMNAQNWVLYVNTLGLPEGDVRAFAIVLFLLLGWMGFLFIVVELLRARALPKPRNAIILLVGSGVVVALLLAAMIIAGRGGAALPVFTQDFAERWTPGDNATVTFESNSVAIAVSEVPLTGATLLTATTENGWADHPSIARLLELDPDRLDLFTFSARPNFDGAMILRIDNAAGELLRTQRADLAAGKVTVVRLPAEELVALRDPARLTLSLASAQATDGESLQLALFGARYQLTKVVPLWLKIVRWVLGIVGGLVAIMIAVDLLRRVRTWRKQVVEVRWYAYLIPLVPLVLIIVYDMPILSAFVAGFAFAVFATLRPGSVSMTIQSMIQGGSSVMPAVLLMIGIGILVTAVLGPSGWSAARGGEPWPVIAAMQPLLQVIIPKSPWTYVLVFGLAAPLALYRGPLNIWGLGFGVAALLLQAEALSPAAIMALLLSVGQVQGICDPTNTQNVWIANELRVDVQALMLRTIPFVWGLVFVALAIGAIKYF